MPTTISTADFWKLLAESRLVSDRQAAELEAKYIQIKGDSPGTTVMLAQWLMGEEVLSRYQAKVLLAGRPGPFAYGDYVVHDRHSEGRLQGTFRASHPGTRHRVLLYFHSGAVVQDAKLWAAVVDQVVKLTKAVHPHLARIYQLCDLGQFKFTVMDDLQGESAEERAAKSPIPPPVACRMVRQAALGAARLLELGQLHGAIRPSNLWIDKQGNVQLLLPPLARDLLAVPKPIDTNDPLAQTELQQQADYIAPDLMQPKRPPDAQTEVYALGCTLFHLLTGRVPFGGDTLKSRLANHDAQPIPVLDPAVVPQPIGQVVAFAMAKDPAKRFRDPIQLAETLGKVLEKIDRAQLRWPPSLPPSRLPEYEAWLRPYGVRPEEPGRASPMNILWSKDDEILGAARSGPPVAMADVPRSAVQSPTAVVSRTIPQSAPSVLNSPDSPLDWVAANPRGARKAGRITSNNKLTLILTILLAILCVIGAVATWLVFSNRSAAEPAADGRSSKSATSATDSSGRTIAASQQEDDPATFVGAEDNTASQQLADAGNIANADNEPRPDGEPSETTKSNASLWAAPTSGSPVSLKHVAPGLQAALVLRPADLLKHPEGEKVFAALGPDVESARRELETIAGTSLADVEQLTIAWVEPMSAAASALTPMFVLRFKSAPDREKIAAQWGKQSGKNVGHETVLQTSSGLTAFWASDDGNVLVVGASDPVEEAARLGASPAPLRREIERILPATDSQRMATLIFVPAAALNGSNNPPSDEWSKLFQAARSFFADDTRAAALSAQLTSDDLFIELRTQGPLERPAAIVAQQFLDRLEHLANSVESHIASLNPTPYSKRLLLRYPQMLKLVGEFTRGGAEGDQAVLRCYLPAAAAHNLLMGAELALAEGAANSAVAGAGGPGAGPEAKPAETIEQKLKHVTSLTFARDTLEKAIQLLADDIGVKAEIIGPDLQLDGITKNQSFGLDEKDKPADEILRDIMLKANPDGKLVYVVKSKEPGGEEMLLVTTRAAAAKRGDKLPPELAAPPKKK